MPIPVITMTDPGDHHPPILVITMLRYPHSQKRVDFRPEQKRLASTSRSGVTGSKHKRMRSRSPGGLDDEIGEGSVRMRGGSTLTGETLNALLGRHR